MQIGLISLHNPGNLSSVSRCLKRCGHESVVLNKYEDFDKYNLDELNVSVDNLYKELKKESKTLNNNIQKIKKNLKLSKKQNSKLSSNSTGMDDTERAIVEMTNSYKDMQIDSFLHALDISLGILGLFYLIYKKTN